jgi:hypothetical protein
MGMRRREHDEWTEIAERYVDGTKFFGPEDGDKFAIEDTSEQALLYRTFLTVAAEQAKAKGLSPENRETLHLFDKAHECATSITCAFIPPVQEPDLDRVRRAFRMSWTATPGNLIHDARKVGGMAVSASDLEHGIGDYLRSGFRDARIDRMLIRALADTELSSFLAIQVGPGIPFIRSPLETARGGMIWPWAKRTLTGAFITAVVCMGFVAVDSYFPGLPDWLVLGGIVVIAGGYLLLTLVSLIALAVHGPKVAATRKAAMETIRAAIDFYTEFHSPGTISLPHYRMRLEEARQKGIVWPQTLWALIDDMEQRGVRHF